MKRHRYFLLFCFEFISWYCFAGGFQVNLQGQKQAGMGHTGTGMALDASSVFFNPGAMSLLPKRFNFSGGSSFIFHGIVYAESPPGIYRDEMIPHIGTPLSLFASSGILRDRLSLGFGIYTPFGSRAHWKDEWKGRFVIQEIELKMIFFQPTVSVKISDRLGIGVGYVYSTGSFYLRKSLPLQDQQGNYGSVELSGSGKGHGFNAGICFKITNRLTVGLDYRYYVKMKIESGSANFVVPSSLAASFPSSSFQASLNLPATLSYGLSLQASPKLLFSADVNFVQWSSYDTLSIDLEKNTDKLKDIASPKLYKDSYIYRLGAQYSAMPSLSIRAGAYYDSSPVMDEYVGPETPDASKIGLTAGVSYMVKEKLSIDVSLVFIEGMKRTVTNQETGFGGTFKSRAVVPGLGVSYRF